MKIYFKITDISALPLSRKVSMILPLGLRRGSSVEIVNASSISPFYDKLVKQIYHLLLLENISIL